MIVTGAGNRLLQQIINNKALKLNQKENESRKEKTE